MTATKNIVALLGAIATLGTLSSFVPASADDAKADRVAAHMSKGVNAAAENDWKTALQEFGFAAGLDPTNARAAYHMGVAFYHLGRLSEASAAELQALGIDPKLREAFIEFSTIEFHRGNPALAKKAIDLAIKNWPDDLELKRISQKLEVEGAKPQAIAQATVSGAPPAVKVSAFAKPALLYSSKDVAGLLRDAEAAMQRCDLPRAKKALQFALMLEPMDPEVHARYCNLLEAEGETAAAVSEAQKAVQLEPSNPQWYLALGWAYSRQGKWPPSYEAFKQAYTKDNNLHDAIIGQCYALAKNGQFKLAKITLHVSDPNAQETSWYHTASGLILEEKGDRIAAYDEVRAALKISPNDYQAKYTIARMAYQLACKDKTQARWKLAAQHARDLLAVTPYDVEAMINLGICQQHLHDTDGALQTLAQAAKISPASASAHGAYASALASAGKLAEAKAEARIAYRIDPKQQLAQTILHLK